MHFDSFALWWTFQLTNYCRSIWVGKLFVCVCVCPFGIYWLVKWFQWNKCINYHKLNEKNTLMISKMNEIDGKRERWECDKEREWDCVRAREWMAHFCQYPAIQLKYASMSLCVRFGRLFSCSVIFQLIKLLLPVFYVDCH